MEDHTYRYYYDIFGRLIRAIRSAGANGSVAERTFRYSYDDNGNMLEKEVQVHGDSYLAGDNTESLHDLVSGSDLLAALTGDSPTNSDDVSSEPATGDTGPDEPSSVGHIYRYGSGNRLQSVTGSDGSTRTFEYADNGAIITDVTVGESGATSRDVEYVRGFQSNRIHIAHLGDSTIHYRYDARGNRIAESHSSGEERSIATTSDEFVITAADGEVVFDVLNNDALTTGSLPTLHINSHPAHGSVSVSEQFVRYVAPEGFVGTDRFTYFLHDGAIRSRATQVTITVTLKDYDEDDDGLIDVAKLEHLNAIRWDPDGDGVVAQGDRANCSAAFPYPVSGMGCPPTGCVGYELTTDLDFDTNGNGYADADDQYWNGGRGWNPIGSSGESIFDTTFDGAGHIISNLFISSGSSGTGIDDVGLFGRANSSARIRRLGLEDVNLTGNSNVGGLVGHLQNGEIHACYVTGMVFGHGGNTGGMVGHLQGGKIGASYSEAFVSALSNNVGGLVGANSSSGEIVASYATTGSISGEENVGGLVGLHSQGASIKVSYATGSVHGTLRSGGLIGRNAEDGTAVIESYWGIEASGQTASAGGVGQTTRQLRIPTGYHGIYANWNVDLDGVGVPDDLWDFGDAAADPVLKVDFDGDGTPSWQEFGNQRTLAGEPAIVPLAPVDGNGRLTVVWGAPADDGGSDIAAYDLRYIMIGSDETVASNWTVVANAWNSGALNYHITGLTAGSRYEAQLRAVNSQGAGPWADSVQDYDVLPTFYEAYVSRGNAHTAVNRYKEAVADFTAAIRINPDSANAYIGRAEAYQRSGQLEEAEADREAASGLINKEWIR